MHPLGLHIEGWGNATILPGCPEAKSRVMQPLCLFLGWWNNNTLRGLRIAPHNSNGKPVPVTSMTLISSRGSALLTHCLIEGPRFWRIELDFLPKSTHVWRTCWRGVRILDPDPPPTRSGRPSFRRRLSASGYALLIYVLLKGAHFWRFGTDFLPKGTRRWCTFVLRARFYLFVACSCPRSWKA